MHNGVISDWTRSIRNWRLWTALGFEDLADRYRRSTLGFAWLSTSFALFILVYVFVFGHGSGVSTHEYITSVSTGFCLWAYISSILIEGCGTYTGSTNWISGTATPYPTFILQVTFRNVVILAFNFLMVLLILVWQKESWTLGILWAIPGLLIFLFTPTWIIALLAPLCARYRDLVHAVQTLVRVLFFATPVLWLPEQRMQLALLAKLNPLSYYIDIIREPLVHNQFPANSWIVVLITTAIGSLIGLTAYSISRNKIVYWL